MTGLSGVRDVEAPLATWRSRVRETFTELDIDPTDSREFAGGLTLHRRGVIEIAEIGGAHQTVSRADRGIRQAPVDQLYFVFQRGGHSVFEAGGDGVALSVGDSVVYDMNRAHRLHFDGRFQQLCAMIPNTVVRDRLGRAINDQLGRVFMGSGGLGRIVGAAALALVDPEVDPGSDTILGDVFLDVLERSVRARAADDARTTGPAERVTALRRFIREHHDRERLSPADAASALGCSLRQVHSIAASHGCSFGRLLLEERLTNAHAMLSRGARVSEAAFASGFADLSHFSRSFKARFGCTPRLMRG